MRILQPTALLFGLLALPILLFYMLRMRRREQPVPSTQLWSMLMRDRRANTPWQRLRRNLLLLLQLLILAGLVLALARPALPVAAVTGDALIVLLDASASMQAVDVRPSRFEAARREAEELIANLAPGMAMTLILVGKEPQVLAAASADTPQLREALAQARPTNGSVDWAAALALAAGAAAQAPTRASVVILSDGGLGAPALPGLPGEVQYLPIGESDDNLAISAVAVQSGAAGVELFLQVRNYADREHRAVLSLDIDGRLAQAEQIVLERGESLERSWHDLPAEGRVYRAHLQPVEVGSEGPLDALALDDVAYAILRPARERRALLFPYQVAPARYSLFLEKALLSLGDLAAYRAIPSENGEITLPEQPFALYIVDGLWPGELPPGPLLMVDPPENPFFTVGDSRPIMEPVRVAKHPLTRYIDWRSVRVAQARMTEPPPGSQILVEAGGLPLVFISELEGRRMAVIAFDLHESDLPLQIAFPILVAELARFLAPPQAVDDAGLSPGEPVDITPGAQVSRVEVTSPSGRTDAPAPAASGFRYTRTDELGLYQIRFAGEGEQPVEQFAINLFEPAESSIRPAGTLPLGEGVLHPTRAGELGQRELWQWLVLGAFLILLVEWWIAHGRPLPGFAVRRRAAGVGAAAHGPRGRSRPFG